MKKHSHIFFIVLFTFFYANALAQNAVANIRFSVPEIALIDIEPNVNNEVHFVVDPTSESGEAPQVIESTDQALWVNYTSAQKVASNQRSVYAQIAGGALPDGLQLDVRATNCRGVGKGQMLGKKTGKVNLSEVPQKIISGIKNCYTGDGEGNGHKLIYGLKITDYGLISSTDGTYFTILYTLSDN